MGGKLSNWVSHKAFLFNVTFGTYVLDWWERCIFHSLALMLFWLIASGVFNTSLLVYGKLIPVMS